MFKRLPCWLMVALAVLAAGPAAAHEWVDYFDTGEAGLSPRGYRTALEVAAYFADAPAGSEVIILAHMDTDEATRFDEALTRRRAWAMMFELLTWACRRKPSASNSGARPNWPGRPTGPSGSTGASWSM